ncbi:MAG: HNH endonuclease [Methanomassiliicoccales archaeon PtaU1.Bin124]|nr:MAG: HNH endonuclease [Methanomassiliicoccales archaeon PtaU1.Bin124]
MHSSCCHAMNLGKDAYCGLKTNHALEPGVQSYVFHQASEVVPISCDWMLFRSCPYKVTAEGKKISSRGSVHCDHCGKRHIPGSLSQKLCGEWSSFKRAYKGTKQPGHSGWYEGGCREEIFSDACDASLRRQLWPRIHITILRRDRFTCQECGRTFQDLPKKRNGRAALEVHHIIPRCRGGTEHPGNLITLCHDCHRTHTLEDVAALRKDGRTEEEVRRLCMEEHLMSIDEEIGDDLSSLGLD